MSTIHGFDPVYRKIKTKSRFVLQNAILSLFSTVLCSCRILLPSTVHHQWGKIVGKSPTSGVRWKVSEKLMMWKMPECKISPSTI
jgi:hypothetical protein